MARPQSTYSAEGLRQSQGQGHIINMGMDSMGGPSGAAVYRGGQRSPLLPSSTPYPPGGLHGAGSPVGSIGSGGAPAGGGGSINAYTSPRMPVTGTLSPQGHPTLGPAKDLVGLSRSASLGHAAYQSHQPLSPTQAQSSLSQQQHYVPTQTLSQFRTREGRPSYSEGTSGPPLLAHSGGAGGGSLLPTHSHGLPQLSAGVSYSPGPRSSMMDTTYTSPPMSHPRSPVGSPYGPMGHLSPSQRQAQPPPQATSQRPTSMYDQYGGASSSSNHASTSRASLMPGATSPALYQQQRHQSPSAAMAHSQLRNSIADGSDYQRGFAGLGGLGGAGDSLPYAYAGGGGGGGGSRLSGAYDAALQSPYQPTSSLGAGLQGPPKSRIISSSSSSGGTDDTQRRHSMASGMYGGQAPQGNDWDQRSSAHSIRMAQPPQQVAAPPPPPPRLEGFRRVRDFGDLKPNTEAAQLGKGRRADPTGGYVSPLKAMTAYLHHTYHLVNPAFFYELSFNPRRVLTKPSKPVHNDGHDNEDSDYILYVNDWLGAEEGNRYLILDILGQGTFGQVVKCQNMKTHEIVAVKVIKNKPAYFNQSMMEVTILEMLNGSWDPDDKHHILRLKDTFIHAKHLCLVFELLSSNLYELIKQNRFQGLSTSLVRVFTTQLLDALTVLNEARLIHCDLKPENILLKTLQTPSIKLVDFGSACHERQTVYTYIQSRFYRSPEVLLGLPYSSAIDMWSLGCIAVELFLGLPLFPGTSEYNQICRIVEMLGLPPTWMLEQGKQTGDFFNSTVDDHGRKSWRLKSLDQYSREHNVQEQPSKKYFAATTLTDIVNTYPLPRKSGKPADVSKEMANRTSFLDFVGGLLNMDPQQRWTPQQAKLHPFITGEKYSKPFKPPQAAAAASGSKAVAAAAKAAENRHQFGGLPQTGARPSGRAYHDAAAYNQHLAQQQSYNSVHNARQAAPPAINNPYASDQAAAQQAAEAQAHAKAAAKAQAQVQAQAHAQAQAAAHAHAQAQARAQAHAIQTAMSPTYGQPPPQNQPQTRSRSNTVTRMDGMPPQLSKMSIDPSGASAAAAAASAARAGGHSLTPVHGRDDPMRAEWERRQQNGAGLSASNAAAAKRLSTGYQDLAMLQQQQQQQSGDYGGSGGAGSWSQASWKASSYQSPPPVGHATSPVGAAGQGGFSVVVDGQDRRMMNPHDAGAGGSKAGAGGGGGGIAAPPPVAYNRASQQLPSGSGAGYAAASGLNSFDPYDAGLADLMPALQPTQYNASGGGASNRHSMLPTMSGGGTGAPPPGGFIPGQLIPSPGLARKADEGGFAQPRRYQDAQQAAAGMHQQRHIPTPQGGPPQGF